MTKTRSPILAAASVALAILLGSASLQAQFELNKGDRIVYIGNTLADRMQHDGWLETILQSEFPDRQLVFRNQGFSGDQVAVRPRNKGFTSPDDYLKISKADVIFVFFGYNESFAGDKGLPEFKKNLAAMVDNYRKLKPNGKSEPRIVLFSPIAHENLKDKNLSNGRANNRRLLKYTAAISEVAADKGTGFVDLFSPSQAAYAAAKEPLTINGVHLNSEGNRKMAESIVQALLGKDVPASASLDSLRQAVINKNWHWFHRYRATDGNDVWGGRSILEFVDGQSNAEVLKHELTMLDVMVANRDKRIHALASGSDLKIDDRNVPKPVPVVSNVGGGSKSSNAEKEGNLNYLSGSSVKAKLKHPKDYKINLFADETMFPELVNPVQMQVDAKGRLWAAAWKTYPKWEPLKPMEDRLLILPDENGDGVADKVITFAKVHNPLGFEFWNGGVLVTSSPELIFLKDTDGDDVADVRQVLLHGLGSADTHHAANNLIFGPDGAIYWQSGIFLHNNMENPWGPSLSTGASAMYRFDPRRFTISYHADNRPNPHGIAFDGWGYHYANDGTGGKSYQVRPDGDKFKMFPLVVKQVRPVAANVVISSANFPDDAQGDFMVCNTIGHLGLKKYDLNREGGSVLETTSGKGKNKKTVKTETKFGDVWGIPSKDNDFLLSEDKNFRPTDAVFGEDGALYISDWHNVIIGHMQHNIRDPNRDHRHGRIYRMVYTKKPLQKPVKIAGASIPELLKNLEHPIDGVRHRTRIELSSHDTKEVMAEAKKWMAKFDPKKKEDAHHLLEALWLHQQHNVINKELLETVLNSPEPHAQVAAKTVNHHWFVVDHTSGYFDPASETEEKVEIEIPAHIANKDIETFKLGGEVFHRDAHCVTCHQPNGMGMPNIYPPLVGSPWVTGDEERLIKLTLHGLWGPIEVLGKKYVPEKGVPPMTAFGALLKDEELAAVLTFVRNSWGNQASAVSPAAVEKVRAATKSQTIFWKPEELLKLHPIKKP